jgi:hypothetical protein
MANAFDIDELRKIALGDLLAWHGFQVRREGQSLRARTSSHNIVVTGLRWFDNKAGCGGTGVINLQMHLARCDFVTACQFLSESFTHSQMNASLAGGFSPHESLAIPERLPFHELVAKHAVRNDSHWPAARDYLVNHRMIASALVDRLHREGTIYANNHHPNPSLVFLHRNHKGTVSGATLRDTRHDSSFRPCLGNKLTAWFTVGDLNHAHEIIAVESPIDALSYHSLKHLSLDQHAVVSCSGAVVPEELMWQAYERKQSFVVALDNDLV